MSGFSLIKRMARRAPVADGRRALAFLRVLAKRSPESSEPRIEALARRPRHLAAAQRLRKFLEIARRGG